MWIFSPPLSPFKLPGHMEHLAGIEPATTAWQAVILPLNYRCITRREKHVYVRLDLTTSRLEILTHYHCANKRFLQLLQNSSKIGGKERNRTSVHRATTCCSAIELPTPYMAEEVGFEPTRQSLDLPVFKTSPFSRLGTPPYGAPAGN